MDHIKAFLDTSTIHGLSWISVSRKWSRLFWIMVVFGGFLGAGTLIYNSFHNWYQSPITTTIETLPISEITFPNVTVCPPENLPLNLNYDILKSENIKLDNNTRGELFDIALDEIQEHFYEEIMTNLSKVEESHRNYNWYHGYSRVSHPYYAPWNNQLNILIWTSATSGNISTQYFDHKFDADKVDGNMNIGIIVSVHPSLRGNKNTNTTLMFKIKKKTMKEFSDNDKISFDYGSTYIDADVTHWTKNISDQSKDSYEFLIDRRLPADAISKLDLELMPGFRLLWNYDKPLDQDPKYRDEYTNKLFARLVNMLDMTLFDQKNIWKFVRQTRKEFLYQQPELECLNQNILLSDSKIDENINTLAEKLKVNTTSTPKDSVSDEILDTAVKIFTYLNHCPPKIMLFMANLVKSTSTKGIILALTNVMKTSKYNEKELTTKVFFRLLKRLSLEHYKKIQTISKRKMKMVVFEDTPDTLESMKLTRTTNHPVHILDQDGELSPTALIPFCEFGGDMSVMGVKIEEFDVPVCNSFRPQIIKDQLCYTVDINDFKDRIDLKGELSLSLFIHYNLDRQLEEADRSIKHSIIVDSIGNFWGEYTETNQLNLEPLKIALEKKYSLNVIKEIAVTDAFLTLEKDVRGCQEESSTVCIARKYKTKLIDKCNCLPSQVKLGEKISQCTAESYDCVASIKVKDSECLQQCSGILFTSYDKKSVEDRLDAGIMKLVEYFLRINKESGIGIFTNMDKEFQEFAKKSDTRDKIKKLSSVYWKFKGFYNFSSQFQEYEHQRTNLNFVMIHFDAPVFDKVTKDRAAKPEDQLSAIGGTMGLLTGFSFISAMEIAYFVFKIALGYCKNLREKHFK